MSEPKSIKSEKLNIKFNATIVDAIEKAAGAPIENCVGDTSVSGMVRILQHSVIDDNTSTAGISRSVAMAKLDTYLEGGSDRFDLLIDITEQLVSDGFLPRSIDTEKMRERKASGSSIFDQNEPKN